MLRRSDVTVMWKNKLFETAKDCVLIEKAPLSDYTTFRVGGPAEILAKPQTEEALCSLLDWVKSEAVPFLLIGNGSNLLVRDGGFDGLVIHIGNALGDVRMEGNCLIAQAGALLSKVATVAADNSLAGMAFAHGIPGSLGGAVYMNAGAYGGEMSQIIEWVRVWTPDGVKKWNVDEMGFGYRHSRLMEENAVVLAACLKLQVGEREAIRSQMKELMQQRKSKQPLEYPSAGSFFKRPQGHFAGALIENAGLKGFTIGGAQISEKHAGFLINHNHATAADVLNVMRAVQEKVFEETGVQMENEVRIVGKDQ